MEHKIWCFLLTIHRGSGTIVLRCKNMENHLILLNSKADCIYPL
ncbi:hypothetical protein RUMHYD_03160 [Blautia hydrogenotrophica DSM 10507]|uniref:Uncharacterized protein n=1 Tax=Blautia hydrogenotrophica (strain DSM 10507 / JCM 14656 / S5a33) TaxID=476272 RepID=C0CQJ7_BLAHS|nr:hypothetical protein RUMHYD_03160 [Blautia hydrogenotrophica DSM 10507]